MSRDMLCKMPCWQVECRVTPTSDNLRYFHLLIVEILFNNLKTWRTDWDSTIIDHNYDFTNLIYFGPLFQTCHCNSNKLSQTSHHVMCGILYVVFNLNLNYIIQMLGNVRFSNIIMIIIKSVKFSFRRYASFFHKLLLLLLLLLSAITNVPGTAAGRTKAVLINAAWYVKCTYHVLVRVRVCVLLCSHACH